MSETQLMNNAQTSQTKNPVKRVVMPIIAAAAYLAFMYVVSSLFGEFGIVDRYWPSTSRVSVVYPSQWEQGEYRTCHMIDSGTVDCATETQDATPNRMVIMDVKFIGKIKPTPYQPWTCQRTEESLTCKKDVKN